MSEGLPEGWYLKDLGEVLTKIEGGGTPTRNIPEFWGDEISWATVKDLTGIYLTKTEEKITYKGLNESSSKLIPANTIIIATRMAVGKSVVFNCDVAINQDLKAIYPSEQLNWKYLLQWFIQKSEYIASMGTGSTVKGIRLEDLKIIPALIPPLPEQKKIAKILTSVDEVIETTETQINKLKDLKKGIMNELLTKGIGHTEFKDSPVGRIPVGWEVTTLGKVGRWSGGGTPSKSNALFWMGNIPWVSPKDMKCENIFRTEDYISEEAISNSSTNLISKNSILIVARSGILKHTLPVAIADCDLTINQDMKSIEIKSDYCYLYIYHFLMANNHKILRACLKAGNTVESLDFNAQVSEFIFS
jgi:type I restriction enzyme, S subunit